MSKSTTVSYKQVAMFYWRHVRAYPFHLLSLSVLIPLVYLCGQYLPALIVANTLSRLSQRDYIVGQPWQSFGNDILLYAGLVFLTAFVIWRLIDVVVWSLERKVPRNIARQVFDTLSHESADFHANHFSGSLVSQTNKITGSYVRIADTTVFSTLPLIAGLGITSVIMWPKAPTFVIFLLLFSTIYIVTAIYASRPVRRAGSALSAAESKQTGYLADMIGNIMAVKSFAGEAYENDEFEKVTYRTDRSVRALMFAHMKQMLYFGAISRTISTLALCIAIISVVSYGTDLAVVFLIVSYTSTITEQLFGFSNSSLRNYNRAVSDAQEMVQILRQRPSVLDPRSPEAKRMHRGTVRFNAVTFTHGGSDTALFRKLGLRIKPGEKVGLVGHSGSGKTTLTRLLLRFVDIDSGSIEIDGQNIAHITQSDLRESISYVPQEPILFHRTIAENIAYGKRNAETAEIVAAAKMAHADEFISRLPKGYDTLVGERGVKLSGGQRQRIAIARALLKNAPILILDEATSALDSQSEALIQDALWKLMEGRTAIVIAHRLSTIQKMDRILVMEHGNIIEQGTHKELLRQNGTYAELWSHQSGGFIEP